MPRCLNGNIILFAQMLFNILRKKDTNRMLVKAGGKMRKPQRLGNY